MAQILLMNFMEENFALQTGHQLMKPPNKILLIKCR